MKRIRPLFLRLSGGRQGWGYVVPGSGQVTAVSWSRGHQAGQVTDTSSDHPQIPQKWALSTPSVDTDTLSCNVVIWAPWSQSCLPTALSPAQDPQESGVWQVLESTTANRALKKIFMWDYTQVRVLSVCLKMTSTFKNICPERICSIFVIKIKLWKNIALNKTTKRNKSLCMT